VQAAARAWPISLRAHSRQCNGLGGAVPHLGQLVELILPQAIEHAFVAWALWFWFVEGTGMGPQPDLVHHHRRHSDGFRHEGARSGSSCSVAALISSSSLVTLATNSSTLASSMDVF
jgi:hypothetical protein